MNELYSELKEEYNYCDCIEIEPFPTINPEYMIGYRVYCNLYNFDLHCPDDCNSCKVNKYE